MSFQIVEEEPKEDSFPTKEEITLMPTPSSPFKLPQTIPQKNSL